MVFQITNDDNAGFCGIPTRNSVSRILCELKKEGVIKIVNQKIVILDIDYLKQYVQC
ncbi:helix-turn-helix domain-containing protein [Holdemanella porci]|uniref:helix-turn-helix domain-containing protein n=1 Tax=Holdemanella porci TaxID=2652276 RepID=UPI003F8EC78E